ncbi:MAG: prenyltransferase [Fibrobacterota bacterium]
MLSKWITALRAYTFPASLIPPAIAALSVNQPRSPLLLLLIGAAVTSIHGGTNLMNDYVDCKGGLDTSDHPGASGLVLRGELALSAVRRGAYLFFALALVLSLPLFIIGGVPVILLGTAGLLGGYFYTAGPVPLKYSALGDIAVFLLMGIFPAAGTALLLGGTVNAGLLLRVLPAALMVSAILNANNIRDRRHDKDAGIRTLATQLGAKNAFVLFVLQILGAYIAVCAAFFYGGGSLWGLLPVLSLPMGVSVIKGVAVGRCHPERIPFIDGVVARLYTLFGVLYCTGLALSRGGA